ncbi:MAG: Crp/Fnr family transcriptional regulator [Betaproteobacteria bacterium]
MTGSRRRQALLAAFDGLDEAQQDALMDFAATLAARDEGSKTAAIKPEPRPAEESVVAAIRRLTRSYPAVERRRLMGPVSTLMAQHAVQGREAAAVIDDLEAVFEQHHLEAARSAKAVRSNE